MLRCQDDDLRSKSQSWGFSGKKWRFWGDFGTKMGILVKKTSIAQNA